MKKILLSFAFLSIFVFANAQVTTSQDWTKTDCNGNVHTLYSYLNSGDVAVMMFEMGCSSCAGAGKVLEHIKSAYDVSNPGVVNFFAMDYVSSHTCAANVSSFMTTNGLTYPSFDHCLTEKNYYTSTSPMPMIIVTAGTSHTILYMKNSFMPGGTDSVDIYNAISLGIAKTGVNELASINTLKLYPNPAVSNPVISFNLMGETKVKIELINILGEKVSEIINESKQKGNYKLEIETAELPKGIYFVSAAIGNSSKTFKLIVQ